MLDAVRRSALQYTESLPNFICTQITHRDATEQVNFGTTFDGSVSSKSGPGLPNASRSPGNANDVIEERLTFFDQMEHYEVISVNGRKAAGQQHMLLAGAISAGEFGSALGNIFDPRSHAEFTWDRTANLGRRRVHVLKFRVPRGKGTIVIDRDTDQKILVRYSGRLFVDSETMQVVRITSQLDLPGDFPITMGETTVDYKPVALAGKTYNLPSHSEVRLKDRSRLYVNQIEFRSYHKFAVESTIHYDSEPSRPNN